MEHLHRSYKTVDGNKDSLIPGSLGFNCFAQTLLLLYSYIFKTFVSETLLCRVHCEWDIRRKVMLCAARTN